MKYWLSFVDPLVDKFLGAVLLDLELDKDLGDDYALNALREKVTELGINPGGEMLSLELHDDPSGLSKAIPLDKVHPSWLGVLLDKELISIVDDKNNPKWDRPMKEILAKMGRLPN